VSSLNGIILQYSLQELTLKVVVGEDTNHGTNHQIIKSPNHQIIKSSNHQIIKSSNHQITKSL
jgi:hypothetical protein